MESVVIDEPYEFVPPYFGKVWPWMLQRFVRRRLRRSEGIEQLQCEGLDRLRESLAAGHSVVLAANHCRPSDPLVMVELCRRAGVVPFTMASWHLFKQGPIQRFCLRRIGGFSVYREGLDRKALQASVDILNTTRRPLVIFPEGVITRTNDRIVALMEGLAFIARSAAKKRAASDPPGQVVVHPVALRYNFHGDIDAALNETLDAIEHRLSWRPRRDSDRVHRIYRVGEALLWLKEIEYFGHPKTGEIPGRLQNLIDGILVPLEEEWLAGKTAPTTVARVKQLRSAVLQDMVAGGISAEERTRRWEQLQDMDLAQQLSHYPPEYVRSNPTPMRILETVEKFEEDLTGVSRIHRPMSVTSQVGEAISVSPQRTRGIAEDPLMTEVERQLREMLDIPIDDRKRPMAGLDATGADKQEAHHE